MRSRRLADAAQRVRTEKKSRGRALLGTPEVLRPTTPRARWAGGSAAKRGAPVGRRSWPRQPHTS
eukprot:298400-Chlamydomonas_euryale.AAC.1